MNFEGLLIKMQTYLVHNNILKYSKNKFLIIFSGIFFPLVRKLCPILFMAIKLIMSHTSGSICLLQEK